MKKCVTMKITEQNAEATASVVNGDVPTTKSQDVERYLITTSKMEEVLYSTVLCIRVCVYVCVYVFRLLRYVNRF